MTNAAIVALRNRIATNTLTGGDQAALTVALDFIAPTFQGPDETSTVVFSDESEAREWIAALYTIAAGNAGGVLPPTSGTLIEPTAAALSVQDVSALVNGQPAIVESFGAEFSLQPIDGMTVDGVTVLSTPDPTRVWERGDTVIGVQAALQTLWFVDPAAGNDEDTGLAGHPLEHKAEIMRRWGSWSPTIDGITVSIVYVSPDTDANDPGLFRPNLINGARMLHAGDNTTTSFTGTLLAVTAKNQATNTPLSSTFTTTTGAIGANLLLINTTRADSVAITQRDLGGGNWRLTQPMGSLGATPWFVTTPNNAWANGDAIQGFPLINVNLAVVGGVNSDAPGDGGAAHVVAALTIWDPDGIHGQNPFTLETESFPLLINCIVMRCAQIQGVAPFGRQQGCMFIGDFAVQSDVPFLFSSGSIGGLALAAPNSASVLRQSSFQDDILLNTARTRFIDCKFVGGIAVDVAGTLIFDGDTNAQDAPVGTFYGTAILNQLSGTFRYDVAAATQFPTSGGLNLNGGATGYSNVTAAGVTTVHGGITLTTAHLDAAAGAAGFGGYAFGGGAAFSQAGAQP